MPDNNMVVGFTAAPDPTPEVRDYDVTQNFLLTTEDGQRHVHIGETIEVLFVGSEARKFRCKATKGKWLPADKHLAEVLDADERDSRAIGALDRLYRSEERWADLADLFIRRIELTDFPSEQSELRCQLGEVYQRRLEDLESAIDCYEQVLEADPDHVDALTALEELVMNPLEFLT